MYHGREQKEIKLHRKLVSLFTITQGWVNLGKFGEIPYPLTIVYSVE